MRSAWALVVVAGVAVVSACTTDYQKGLDDPTYAGPNALADQVPPGASIDQAGASSSGAVSSDTLKCGTRVPLPAGCTVTFKNEVITALKAGSCGAGVSCHAPGGVSPTINFDDPHATLISLANYSAQGGKFYVNPCKTDLTESKIVANLDPANPDHGSIMPAPAGLAAAVPIVKTWVACGSPE